MKIVTNLIIVALLIFSSPFSLRASDNSSDSSIISKIVNNFYEWYLNSINKGLHDEFKPKFIEDKDGMTTLDYSQYIENLRIYNFSDSLIEREKLSYQKCIENLSKVKFSDFGKTLFIDLDEYEQANCDFGNYYRWSGGQEPIKYISVSKIEFKTVDSVLVRIQECHLDTKTNKKQCRDINTLRVIKLDNKWYIDNFDSWELR